MSQAPYHNQEQFERAVARLIEHADAQNRGGDLDRVVAHLQKAPEGVSRLGSLMALIDDDFRAELKQHIDAYRRFAQQKGKGAGDEELVDLMLKVYRGVRG